jgi:hypothetical protein
MADETDYMAWSAARFSGDPRFGDPRIYNVLDQKRGTTGRSQDPEHGAIDACGAPGFERWRTRLRRRSYRRRTLPEALTI